MRQLALRIGITEDELSHGERRLHPEVERRLREVEDAESAGGAADRAHAYAALGRTTARVARTLESMELTSSECSDGRTLSEPATTGVRVRTRPFQTRRVSE